MKLFKSLISISLFILSGCNIVLPNNTPSSNLNSSTPSISNSSTSISTSTSSSLISTNSSSSSSTSSSTKIEESSKEEIIIEDFGGYYKPNKQTLSHKKMRESYIYKDDLPSKGDSKIIVIPVKFKDSNYALEVGGYDKVREDINKAFFGKDEETGWESLKSYYQKSSYGNLNISGVVTDWFELDKTFYEVDSIPFEEYYDPSTYVLREAGRWYQETYGDADEYDLDDDGFIDSIWLVYDYEAVHNYNIDWAYVYWDFARHEVGTVENPIPYTYAWAGISFLYTGGYKDENNEPLVDAHTFIHETGHLLGLQDYYDYNHQHSYSGGLDMMDLNIGDHTGLTKYMLDWTSPYVVKKNCEITIRSFEESGDLILVKKDWNGSSMDEYLLIELYTPTGLNEKDSKENYGNKYPKLFQEVGVKIYHVDARLGYYENGVFRGYTDEIISSGAGHVQSTQLAHSNTANRSVNPKFAYYKLIEKGDANKLDKGNVYATNDTLFKAGDVFDPEQFNRTFINDGKYNDGERLGFIITVKSIENNQATIEFIRA